MSELSTNLKPWTVLVNWEKMFLRLQKPYKMTMATSFKQQVEIKNAYILLL